MIELNVNIEPNGAKDEIGFVEKINGFEFKSGWNLILHRENDYLEFRYHKQSEYPKKFSVTNKNHHIRFCNSFREEEGNLFVKVTNNSKKTLTFLFKKDTGVVFIFIGDGKFNNQERHIECTCEGDYIAKGLDIKPENTFDDVYNYLS